MNPLSPPARLNGDCVVRASGSSFAPAFRLLPPDRRNDLETLYAFCRAADDIADHGDHDLKTRREALEEWRAAFLAHGLHGAPEDLRSMMQRRKLAPGLFVELLDGIATDLHSPVRMNARADLDLYCHRVAGVVGLLCLPIFGADSARCRDYAETLGRALQYTNILRDTASDLKRGRIYYPLDELTASGLDEGSFMRDDGKRRDYLETFAAGAAELFTLASDQLPAADRRALRPARMMAAVYAKLLRKMRADGLRVTEQRYRLTSAEKITALAEVMLGRQ